MKILKIHMKHNNYIFNGKPYGLGGLINGEIDNQIITSGGDCDVYDIVLSDERKVSLSNNYGIPVDGMAIAPSALLPGDVISDGSKATVVAVEKRAGTRINIGRAMFALNGVLISNSNSPRKPKEIWTKPNSSYNQKDSQPVNSGPSRR